jgi:hypothetical protein
MHAPGCCDSQTVPPIQLDPAAFVASSDAMACMACSSYTSTGTFVMLYSTQRAHAVGVYICSRRRPKHKDDLHFAPIKNTRTPAKPRIQYVQNPASFCCRSSVSQGTSVVHCGKVRRIRYLRAKLRASSTASASWLSSNLTDQQGTFFGLRFWVVSTMFFGCNDRKNIGSPDPNHAQTEPGETHY